MDRTCPMCNTPMVERNTEHVCPRNDIGDCAYDPYSYELDVDRERDSENNQPY
ncbi:MULTISPECIES: hypothetical protein [Vibrio]|jgi:protein PhnA|uniref:Uncharacterized protein n=2 Tax=Vibrio TaxID=662 RepID=A0ABW7IPV7_9VIBR|nr:MULTISPECIES: hypothetical protein [Vibrio]MCF4172904.1 hypothetical protein [Vibrio sp. McD22-P3]MCG9623706.1 hypothetical protein [Vibrio mediterranei]MCG9660858.1 hypothetical protein [Vibrio mediterranei]MCG9663628.1 hypothetical protein [Vibrio mediterranei]MCG9789105.1 hypothetical protein [Vibrio mediterranei]